MPPSTDFSAATGRARVLLADADAAFMRRLRLLLLESGRCLVTVASRWQRLIHELSAAEFDLLLVDPALPGCGDLGVLRKLRDAGPLGGVPKVCLLHTRRESARVDAWHLGALDAIVLPVSDVEMRARICAALERARATDAGRERPADLAGRLACVSFAELVSVIASQHRGGVLSLWTERGRGKVLFHGGRIVHATFLGLSGHAAVFALMAEERGIFSFDAVELAIDRVRRTVTWDPTALIIEGARLLDEQRAADAAATRGSMLPLRVAAPGELA
jgi:DNA-binding response OmpR family regulator